MLPSDQNLVELIADSINKRPDAPAFTCLGHTLSFGQLDQLSDAFAAWLVHEQVLQPGERVAIQLPNLLQYPVVALGVLKARGVIVNVNPLYTPVEIRHQLRDSGARFLVVLQNTAFNVAGVLDDTAVERVVLTEVGDLHAWPKSQAINLMLRYVKKAIRPFQINHSTGLCAALRIGHRLSRDKGKILVQPAAADLAVLQYTGGTTGVSKGAMLSHRNLVNNLLQLNAVLADDCPGAGAVMIAPLPLYHVYAFTMNFLVAIHRGHHSILIPNPRDMKAFMKVLRNIRINGFVGINTLYKLVLEHPDFHKVDFSELRISSSGGMALSRRLSELWKEKTGSTILEGYGLTECSPVISVNNYRQYRYGTVGKPVPGTELCLKAPDGSKVGVGEAGEVCVKGPQVMVGYWQRPEENARVFDADGMLHTGDVAIQDEDGYLTIIDRIKDIIIISGFNVFPNEIEDHVCTHPAVADACAIATGDEYNAQIKLYVVSRHPGLDAGTIIDYCRTALAPYKIPKLIEFRDSLPKSNVGKVLRRQLREDHALQVQQRIAQHATLCATDRTAVS